jgi:hypothetical protein
VLKESQCLQHNIKNRVDFEHKRFKRAEDEMWLAYEKFKHYKEQIQLPVSTVAFIFGITSNTILLIIITFNKSMRSDRNIYIINLAISDMILLTLFFFLDLAEKESVKPDNKDIYPVFLVYFHSLSVGLSAYTVALLNIHRYRVTVKPFDVCVYSQITWRETVAKLSIAWIPAALFALPTTLWVTIIPKFGILVDETYYKCVVLFDLLFSCVPPLCVIVISYIMTDRLHVESSCFISDRTQHRQLNTRKITAKFVSGLTFVFLISYVPHYVLTAYTIFNMTGELSVRFYNMWCLYEYSAFFLLINSCLNPVAVFCTSPAFRKHLKRYLTRCCKTNSSPTDLQLTRRN